MNEWTKRDWDTFYCALPSAIEAMAKEHSTILDKSVIGLYAFRVAKGVVCARQDWIEDTSGPIPKASPDRPKNFGNA